MKILHIISSGGMYGAEAVILNLSRSLDPSSHSSVLAVFSNSSNPNLQLHEAATRQGIESHLIPCRGQMDPSVLQSIRRLADRVKPDVVHAHGYKADIYTYLAMRKSSIPLVSTCHTWYDNDLVVSLYGAADRYVLRKYAAVVSVSDEVTQRLLRSGVAAQKIHLVRNGIELQPFDAATPTLREDSRIPHGNFIVGLIGRLASEKGVDIFLRAAARVVVAIPSASFVVAGDGPDRRALEAMIYQLKLRDKVFMLGRRDDMPSIYASLDIMVSSSRQEGLPIALLEGMASRLPIIATSVGDVPSLIIHDESGMLVPAEDDETLAQAIVSLLRDSAARQRLGARARQTIEQEFSANRMAADYLHVYEQAAMAKRRAAAIIDQSKVSQVQPR